MLIRVLARRLSVVVVTAAAAAYAPAALAQAVLIDFDTDPSTNTIAPGTILNTVYASMGVTFSRVNAPGQSGWQIYANSNQPAGFGSAPNVITLYNQGSASDMSENKKGLVRATFASPASSACIDVLPDNPGSPQHAGVLRAYDAGGALLAEATSPLGVTQTLCVSAFRIRRVEFSGHGDTWARFDNLSITYGAGPMIGPLYLPGGANQPGLGTTRWRTDLEILNRGSFASTVTLSLLVWNQDNSSPAQQQLTVQPGEALRIGNVLDQTFGFTGAATLRLTAIGGSLVVNARTYNDDPGGTYGQLIPAMDLDRAVQPGGTGYLVHLSQSVSPTSGFRTNLGLVSASPFALTVDVELFRADGTSLGTRSYMLRPYESIQASTIFTAVTASQVDDGYITVTSATPGAVFFAYASAVDNLSGDAVFITAQ